MGLRPFSSSNGGMFISIDGPSGAGKSTIVRDLAQMLVAVGESVHMTAEPSSGPIGPGNGGSGPARCSRSGPRSITAIQSRS
jgi:energy-coupling factor transporter ATP-binding protein EcfA2